MSDASNTSVMWACMDCPFVGLKDVAFVHSEEKEHLVILQDSDGMRRFKQDCGNVPFLHCEDGCDCGDCGMCWD